MPMGRAERLPHHDTLSDFRTRPRSHSHKPGLTSAGGIGNHFFTSLQLKYSDHFLFVLKMAQRTRCGCGPDFAALTYDLIRLGASNVFINAPFTSHRASQVSLLTLVPSPIL